MQKYILHLKKKKKEEENYYGKLLIIIINIDTLYYCTALYII